MLGLCKRFVLAVKGDQCRRVVIDVDLLSRVISLFNDLPSIRSRPG